MLFLIVYTPACGKGTPHSKVGVVVKVKSHAALTSDTPWIFDGPKQVVVALTVKLARESNKPETSNLD